MFFILIALEIYSMSNAQLPDHQSKPQVFHENILNFEEIKGVFSKKLKYPILFNDNYKTGYLTWLPDTINMVKLPDIKSSRTYIYDSFGNISKFKTEYSDSIYQGCNNYNLFYDSNNRLVIVIEKDCSNESNNLSRESYFYDDCGNLSINLAEEFENGEFVNSARLIYTYNDKCQRLTLLFQLYEPHHWINVFNETITYDNLGNTSSDCWEKWNGEFWEIYSKEFYNYDSIGRIVSYLYSCENVPQSCKSRKSYFYNENGELSHYIHDKWNNEWLHYEKINYLYENKKIISLITEKWQNNSWNKTFKTLYTYTENYLPETQITGHYVNEVWITGSKTINIYDQSLNKISEVEQEWKDSIWTNLKRLVYEYDDNGNSRTGRNEIWQNDEWELSGSDMLQFYSDNQELYNKYYPVKNIDLTYYEASWIKVETLNTIDNEQVINDIKIYPNPASDRLIIEIKGNPTGKGYINSYWGETLLSFDLSNNQKEVDLMSFKEGIYIVRIQKEDNIEVHKFVIKR